RRARSAPSSCLLGPRPVGVALLGDPLLGDLLLGGPPPGGPLLALGLLGARLPRRPVLQQLLEQRPVVHQRLAQVLGGGLGAVVAGGDGVGGPVVVHHLGVVDRDVGGPLLEVVDRVAAVAHDRGDQPVGLAGGLGRLVDELGLGVAPGLEVAGAGLGLERDDVEALATL